MILEDIIKPAQTLGWTVATAESCTGGMVAAALTDPAGASAVFCGGFVTYSNAIKEKLLGVTPTCLNTHGAVSAQTVAAMAKGALNKTGATLALSVSGIAGPTGATKQKPLGLVHFATCTTYDLEPMCTHKIFKGGRAAVRKQATDFALSLIAGRIAQATTKPQKEV